MRSVNKPIPRHARTVRRGAMQMVSAIIALPNIDHAAGDEFSQTMQRRFSSRDGHFRCVSVSRSTANFSSSRKCLFMSKENKSAGTGTIGRATNPGLGKIPTAGPGLRQQFVRREDSGIALA